MNTEFYKIFTELCTKLFFVSYIFVLSVIIKIRTYETYKIY